MKVQITLSGVMYSYYWSIQSCVGVRGKPKKASMVVPKISLKKELIKGKAAVFQADETA